MKANSQQLENALKRWPRYSAFWTYTIKWELSFILMHQNKEHFVHHHRETGHFSGSTDISICCGYLSLPMQKYDDEDEEGKLVYICVSSSLTSVLSLLSTFLQLTKLNAVKSLSIHKWL